MCWEHGIVQFINLYHRTKDIKASQLKWGDEIEYILVKFDHANKKVRVALRATELLTLLQAHEKVNEMVGKENRTRWSPEFAEYMLEGTPGVPYGSLLSCFNVVEHNMRMRRTVVNRLLENDESLLSTNFPSLGTPDFTYPAAEPTHEEEDGIPRFKNLLVNTHQRRGDRADIHVPVFKDVNTPSLFLEALDDEETRTNVRPDHILLDHMGFGMGLCCLQVTFQATNMDEARWLYDQLTPLTPIFLALSAATPMYRGYLSDLDCRWDVAAESSDDRTPAERGLEPLPEGQCRIQSSRFGNTYCYIHPSSSAYNDVRCEYDKRVYQKLLDGGVDEHLSRHIAHLFIRDPLQVYRDRLEQDDAKDTEHFETIQSSVWMCMRFKPPPPDSGIGWRVEFRPTEVQLTDFENAAFCCFLVLITRILLSYRISLLMPLSQVHENMSRAQRRDAVLREKFHFRSHLENGHGTAEMTMDELINGKKDEFPGLVPLVLEFLDESDVDFETRETVTKYMRLIEMRASGAIPTDARWMRDFVDAHPDYQHDSRVPDTTLYDLMKHIDDVSRGKVHDSKLLGEFRGTRAKCVPHAVLHAEEEMTISAARRKHHEMERQMRRCRN
ncbi:glutamate--cysteine ligase catalytic subunit [Aphelenchoides avenae]|nr:glutamate--cysteine ligase catalytic subunit [Aphelenchus avenae]